MRGLDYKWIEALDAVVKQRSFERAAEQLYISQSAVSQRIKQLEVRQTMMGKLSGVLRRL